MNTGDRTVKSAAVPGAAGLFLAVLLSAGSLGKPHTAQAQVRPEVGGTISLLAGLGGDAWSGFEEAVGLGVEVGAGFGYGWRVGAGADWSQHDRQTGRRIPGDLWRFSVRIRRNFPIPEPRLRPFLGIRGGVAAIVYDTSVLAGTELDMVPNTRVTESHAGLLLGPELGVRADLSDSWAAELRGTCVFADLFPVVTTTFEEPGWSNTAAVSAALMFRL